MLPKPEKQAKKAKILPSQMEQLDLVKTIDSADKVNHKRHYILLFIILTVGLSLIFWAYRHFKSFLSTASLDSINLTLPNFSHRSLGLNNLNLKTKTESVLGANSPNWHIYLKTYGSSPSQWQYQPESDYPLSSLDTVFQELQSQPSLVAGPIKAALPQGLTLHEKSSGNANMYQSQLLIKLPDSILIVFRIKNSDTQTINRLLPDLVSALYWQMALI